MINTGVASEGDRIPKGKMKETTDIVYSQVQTAPQHVLGTFFAVQARSLSRKELDMSFILLTIVAKAIGYGAYAYQKRTPTTKLSNNTNTCHPATVPGSFMNKKLPWQQI